MPLIPRDNPYPGFRFTVSIAIPGVDAKGQDVKGAFSEVSGLEVTLEPIEYRTGKDDATPIKRPGQRKYANIVLKRGVTANIEFWNWVLQGINGKYAPVNGSITLLDEAATPGGVITWNFKSGWACKFTGPGLNAKNNEVAMETVEICHEGLTIDGQTP